MADATPTYYSPLGPQDGLFSGQDTAEDLPVFVSSCCKGEPIGIAHPVGWISDCDVSIKLFRLRIHNAPMNCCDASLNDLWVCDRRIFVRFAAKVELL
ncbi:hypothetical protein SAMN05444166_8117 [Singulisphaera sp. GP187]|nr:hypothetical protein SAMN05444166_8117 [Singulisphaera sp. GP187]